MKPDWIWLPYGSHLICADNCRFRLTTVVQNRFVVSTLGELWPPDRQTRELIACAREIVIEGPNWDLKYIAQVGYQSLGISHLYETAVSILMGKISPSGKATTLCSRMGAEPQDLKTYMTAEDARMGHLELCHKWDVCEADF